MGNGSFFQEVVSLLHSVVSNVKLLMCRPSHHQLAPLPRSVSTCVPLFSSRINSYLRVFALIMAFKILKMIYHDYRVLLEKYWIVIYNCHNFSYMTNFIFSE